MHINKYIVVHPNMSKTSRINLLKSQGQPPVGCLLNHNVNNGDIFTNLNWWVAINPDVIMWPTSRHWQGISLDGSTGQITGTPVGEFGSPSDPEELMELDEVGDKPNKSSTQSINIWYIWGFPKIGGKPPKWMVKTMENPIKMDDLGGPLFLETPIWWAWWGYIIPLFP